MDPLIPDPPSFDRPFRHLRPAVLLLGLAACAGPRADEARFAQQALIGMPVDTLYSCAGVPDREASADTARFLSYESFGGGYAGPSTSVGVAGGSSGTSVGIGLGFPLIFGSGGGSWCEATFTVAGGTVRQVRYTSDSDLGQCYSIVENCLVLIPPEARPAGAD